MYKHPKINRDKITSKEALDILIEGNQRFKPNTPPPSIASCSPS